MKGKFQVGAEFDFLTRGELDEALTAAMTSWRVELGRGMKFPKFSAQAVSAGGVWSLNSGTSNNNQNKLGPEPGFIWSVMRFTVSGGGVVPGTDIYSAYVGDPTPSKLVTSGLTRSQNYNPGALVLGTGETLAFAGAATGAGTDVVVSGQAIELPVQLAWMLL